MAAALENDMTSAAGRLVVPGIPGMPQNSEQAAVDVTIVASANDWAVLSSSGRSLGTSARRADRCPLAETRRQIDRIVAERRPIPSAEG